MAAAHPLADKRGQFRAILFQIMERRLFCGLIHIDTAATG